MRSLAKAALLSIAACATPLPAPPPAATTTPRAATLAVAREPEVEAALASPRRVLYSASTMHAPPPTVRVTITNPSSSALDVSDLRVRLEVVREGVTIPCGKPSEPEQRAREPLSLAPGASETYLRTVDCPLPLAGTYAARVFVAFGHDGPWSEGRAVRELAIQVAAPPDAQPRAIDAVPGLFAGIGAGCEASPTLDGKGRLYVSLVNARRERIAVPPLRLAVRVRKLGTLIPCEDEPAALPAPAMLEPGSARTLPVELSCLGLGVEGTYDVDARLVIDESARPSEHPLGTLRIFVSTDPARNQRIWPWKE